MRGADKAGTFTLAATAYEIARLEFSSGARLALVPLLVSKHRVGLVTESPSGASLRLK